MQCSVTIASDTFVVIFVIIIVMLQQKMNCKGCKIKSQPGSQSLGDGFLDTADTIPVLVMNHRADWNWAVPMPLVH